MQDKLEGRRENAQMAVHCTRMALVPLLDLDFTRHPRIMYSVLQQTACISSKDAMNDDLVDERKGLDESSRVRV